MLRNAAPSRTRLVGLVLVGLVGAACALLVARGNPGNSGICGACYLRDAAGALGLIGRPDPKVDARFATVRPELVGVVLGALALALVRRRFVARSGSHAASRLILGAWMGVGALVFLGCPFRMLQRIGGGDANALVGLLGFVPGVLAGQFLEHRGYRIGSTSPAPAPVGLQGPILWALLFGVAFAGWLAGAAPGSSGAPARAPWALSLGIGTLAGAAFSATGFCTVTAIRQVVVGPRWMLLGIAVLVAGYAAVAMAKGRFHAGFANQPLAHTDGVASVLAMALVGLSAALAGGCPVRQLVMTGEGNGDAFVTTVGILLGAAVAHGLGWASSPAGATGPGQAAVGVGLAWTLGYGILRARRGEAPAAGATSAA